MKSTFECSSYLQQTRMLQKCLVFILLFIDSMLYHQTDWTLTFERVELHSHNENYVKNVKFVTYKYNRTTPLCNATLTFTRDFDNFQVVVQAYKFMSNEYRLFPTRFQFDFCEATAKNDFGLGRIYYCGNFSRCPPIKGIYPISLCNWAPDGSRFPPYVPDGGYMVRVEIMYLEQEVITLDLYITVSRPIKCC